MSLRSKKERRDPWSWAEVQRLPEGLVRIRGDASGEVYHMHGTAVITESRPLRKMFEKEFGPEVTDLGLPEELRGSKKHTCCVFLCPVDDDLVPWHEGPEVPPTPVGALQYNPCLTVLDELFVRPEFALHPMMAMVLDYVKLLAKQIKKANKNVKK